MPRGVRTQRARWWLVCGGAVGLVALLAGFGGLRTSPGRSGPELAAGQPIELTNWTVIVHSAELGELTPGAPGDKDVIRVRLTVTLTADESDYLTPELISVRPGTDVPTEEDGSVNSADRRFGDFDPDVSRDIDLTFWYPAYDASYPGTPPAPDQVLVVVRDETVSSGFLDRGTWSEGWSATCGCRAPTNGCQLEHTHRDPVLAGARPDDACRWCVGRRARPRRSDGP